MDVIARRATPQDAAALHALLACHDLRPDLFERPPADDDIGADALALVNASAPARDAVFVVVSASDPAVLDAYAAVQAGRLSYGVRTARRRMGIASRLIACCSAATGQARLEALVRRDNVASSRLLESLGFRFAGLVPASRDRPGPTLRYVLAGAVRQRANVPG